jgi:transposase
MPAVAPPFFPSSKKCAECGHVVENLSLSARIGTCPACGVEHDRDANAARNLVAWLQTRYRELPGTPVESPLAGQREKPPLAIR